MLSDDTEEMARISMCLFKVLLPVFLSVVGKTRLLFPCYNKFSYIISFTGEVEV
jgi:hypothetical protein